MQISTKEISHSEKKDLAQKGKELNPESVEFSAIKKFGVRAYRKELADYFDVSGVTIHNVFHCKVRLCSYQYKSI